MAAVRARVGHVPLSGWSAAVEMACNACHAGAFRGGECQHSWDNRGTVNLHIWGEPRLRGMNVLHAPPGLQSGGNPRFFGFYAASGVRWQSGDASDCKSADAGSIPARTSSLFNTLNTIFHKILQAPGIYPSSVGGLPFGTMRRHSCPISVLGRDGPAAKVRRDLHDVLTGQKGASVGKEYSDGCALDDLKAGIDARTFPGPPGVPLRSGPGRQLIRNRVRAPV
jgi:hypothetical protein